MLILPGWLAAPRGGPVAVDGAAEAPRRIEVNRAPWFEWTLLDGIGEARARRIVAWRAERGGIRSIEELQEVPGMPRGWLDRARPFLELARDLDASPRTGENRPAASNEGNNDGNKAGN